MISLMQPMFKKITVLYQQVLNFYGHRGERHQLARHILEIHQKTSNVDIISHSAGCIRNLVNYKLFAFALKKDDHIDVWIDSSLYEKPIEQLIIDDFKVTDRKALNFIHSPSDCPVQHPDNPPPLSDLLSFEIIDDHCYSKAYLLHEDPIMPSHDEMIRLILQTCTHTLLRQDQFDLLSNAAAMDPLTGCYNRREFTCQIKKNISGALRHINDLSLVMFDIDHFKGINDEYGHLAGDRVLKQIASMIQNNMRNGDILARYGGDEFAMILPGTGKKEAMELAERLRRRVAAQIIRFGKDTIRVTASFGVAELDHEICDMAEFIQEADDMLYKAKLQGRNLVMPGLMKLFSMPETAKPLESFI